MSWYRRLFNAFRRDRLDEEIDKELAFHIAERIDDLVASGYSENEARRTSQRQFGNYTLQKERTREMDLSFVGDVWRDVRYGVRQLRRSPAFTLVAVLALGIGVGANVTIFTFINGWLFRPIDAKEPSRLVRVSGPGGDTAAAGPTDGEAHILLDDYFEYRDQNQSFSSLAAGHIGGPARVRTNGPPQMIPITPVTGNYFETLGVAAMIGRTIGADDAKPGAGPVILLTEAGWRRFFDANPRVVGTTATVNGVSHTVVGVTPEWFTGTNGPMVPQIYVPITEGPVSRPFRRVQLIGRLKPGISEAQAHADLSRVAAQLTARDQVKRPIEIYAARAVFPFMLRVVSLLALMFGLIVGAVLLVACDNIAILMTIRSSMRRREIGIRLALGASPFRLLVQLLVESALLCTAAGFVGVYIAFATAKFATQFYMPVPMPFALTFKPDWRVAAFAIGISCAATLLCGLAPALRSLRMDVVTSLKGSALTGGVRSILVITQVTLSTALLVTAVVLAHSLTGAVTQDRGFVSDGVVMSTIAMSGEEYSPQRRLTFLEALLPRLQQVPGVSSVTIVDSVPLARNVLLTTAEWRSGPVTGVVYTNHISRGFFQTLKIPLLAGRDFTVADNVAPAVVGIVNETLAHRFWPGENPIGQHLQAGDGSVLEVVGLARDSKYESLDESPRAHLYRPMAEAPTVSPTFLIKATGDPAAVVALVRLRVAEVDPEQVPYNLMTLDDRLNLGMILNRAAAAVSGSLGLLALALGSIGIYGTMAFLAQTRQRELGVRLALGATPSSVMMLMTRQGIVWTSTGLLLGVIAGWVAAFGLSRVVHGVTVTDPLAFVLTPVVLATAAYAACWVPARRASRLDPLVVLRDE
jgi:predicted permease